MSSTPLSRTLTNSSVSSFAPSSYSSHVEPDSAWSLTVIRTIGLERLRPGGTGKAWKPLVCISVESAGLSETPKSPKGNSSRGSEQADVYETTLGTDGQNPNLKVPFYLPHHSSNSRLSISVFHTPPSKKKGRSSRRTAVASASSASSGSSCQLSLGNLWSRQQRFGDTEDALINDGVCKTIERNRGIVNIKLTPHAPQKRTSNGSVSSRGKSSSSQTSYPMLVLKLMPPVTLRDRKPLGLNIGAANTGESSDGSLTLSPASSAGRSDLDHRESPIQEDEHAPLLPPLEALPENEIRRRPRKKRRVTGFCVDSDEDIFSCSASDSSEDDPEEDVKWQNDGIFDHTRPIHDDDCDSDVTKINAEPPGYIVRFITFASTLPVYTPRPSANSDTFHATDDNDKFVMPGWVMRIVSAMEYVLGSFTLYDSLRAADVMCDEEVGEGSKRDAFNAVFLRLQVEWTYVGGLLVAVAAVDTAVFAMEPGDGTLFEVDDISRAAVATSCMSAGLGLTCDSWFLLRYNWADLDTFITRARDLFDTYFFFALAARLPGLLLSISALSLLTFFARVAFAAFPTGSLVLCALVGLVMSLQFLVYGFVRGARGVGRAGRACKRLIVRGRGRMAGPIGGAGSGLAVDAESGLTDNATRPAPPVVSLRSIPPMARSRREEKYCSGYA